MNQAVQRVPRQLGNGVTRHLLGRWVGEGAETLGIRHEDGRRGVVGDRLADIPFIAKQLLHLHAMRDVHRRRNHALQYSVSEYRLHREVDVDADSSFVRGFMRGTAQGPGIWFGGAAHGKPLPRFSYSEASRQTQNQIDPKLMPQQDSIGINCQHSRGRMGSPC